MPPALAQPRQHRASPPPCSTWSSRSSSSHPLSPRPQHIASSNPLSPPVIDPKYLQSPLDTYLLAKAGAYLRRTAAQAKLAAVVASEKEPGLAVQSHDDWMTWVRSTVRTECVLFSLALRALIVVVVVVVAGLER